MAFGRSFLLSRILSILFYFCAIVASINTVDKVYDHTESHYIISGEGNDLLVKLRQFINSSNDCACEADGKTFKQGHIYCGAKAFLEQLAMRVHRVYLSEDIGVGHLTTEAGKVRRNVLIFVHCPVSCYVGLNT